MVSLTLAVTSTTSSYGVRTSEEHLIHLSSVFGRLRNAKLKVHPGKYQFAVDRIDFLGHTVSAKGLAPQEEKVAAVRELAAPTDIPSLRCKEWT